MTRKVLFVAGLLALTATSLEGNGGVFVTNGDVGSVHHMGGVVQGSNIVLSLAAKQDGLDLTCPMKITLVFMGDNNSNRLVKRVARRNALTSQVVLNAPISGEVVLFLQNQNANHRCNLTFDAAQSGTIPGALGRNQTSQDNAVDAFEDDVPPELAMPLHPGAARQAGLP